MKENRKVAVVTGTRAEYGLLRPVIKRIADDPSLELCLLVTGSHLCESLGSTVAEIEADGYPIAERIDILSGDPTTLAYAATAKALRRFAEFFMAHDPDVVVVLGDRYETFAAATAAAMCDIPVAHISGGETTEGAKDEFFRHCITKMSALHFAAAEAYRKRIIQLGEQPGTVFFAGSLGAENILTLPVVPKKELSERAGFDFEQRFLLCTLHPETLGGLSGDTTSRILLAAIEKAGLPCLFTAANADEGGAVINENITGFCEKHGNMKLVKSLGAVNYLSAMRYCAAVVGNSSSAIVESPTLKKPAVNIGDRQTGRIMGDNIICCGWDEDEIAKAIKKAVSPEFAASIKDMESPFGKGDASRIIVDAIKERLPHISLKKTFYDVDFEVKE